MRKRCVQPPKPVCKEIDPKRYPQKIKVFNAGYQESGGSIKAMATLLGTTENNVVMHIKQCHADFRFGYTYEDDWYEITGMSKVQ